MQVFVCRPEIIQLLLSRNLDRAPLVGIRLHYGGSLRRNSLLRGLMLHYLHVFPWTVNLTLALLISSVIFGFNHLYQGAGGVAGTAIVGFLFGLLFLLTGNLLLPIILHGVMDLRMLAILRPPADTPS
jgi:Type II CAAX prenyl endopeptidase Rce1-like